MKLAQFIAISLFSIGVSAGLFSDELTLVADKDAIVSGQEITVQITSKKKYYPKDLLQMYISTSLSKKPVLQQNIVYNGDIKGQLSWTATVIVPELDKSANKAQICVRKNIKTNMNIITGNDKKGCTPDLRVTWPVNTADISGGKQAIALKPAFKNKYFDMVPVEIRPGDYVAGMTVKAPESILPNDFQVILKSGLKTIPVDRTQQKFISKGKGIFEFSFITPNFGKWNKLSICVKNTKASLIRNGFFECSNDIYTLQSPKEASLPSEQKQTSDPALNALEVPVAQDNEVGLESGQSTPVSSAENSFNDQDDSSQKSDDEYEPKQKAKSDNEQMAHLNSMNNDDELHDDRIHSEPSSELDTGYSGAFGGGVHNDLSQISQSSSVDPEDTIDDNGPMVPHNSFSVPHVSSSELNDSSDSGSDDGQSSTHDQQVVNRYNSGPLVSQNSFSTPQEARSELSEFSDNAQSDTVDTPILNEKPRTWTDWINEKRNLNQKPGTWTDWINEQRNLYQKPGTWTDWINEKKNAIPSMNRFQWRRPQ